MDKDLIPNNWEKRGNIITVIGVGGGGNNAVNHMFNEGMEDIDFIVCNTDMRALEMSPVPFKIQLGPLTTKGLGAGTDFNVGRKAALESIDEIRASLGPDTEMVFVTCGMGGGTGTGAAPIVAQTAKEKGLLTVGVVTIPFRDEGEEALYRAIQGIKELTKNVDCILIIDNQKLYQLHGDLDVFNAFPKADDVLATAVKSIAEIITCGGYINVDFADVKKVMQNSGVALMGIGEASGPNRAETAVNMAFHSPLLNNLDLSNVRNALVNITSSDGENALTMSEMAQIMDYTKKYTGTVINFKRGIVKKQDMGDKVSVTIIATGFDMAQLPVIDEPVSARGNRVEITLGKDSSQILKHGTPYVASKEIRITRQRSTGVPVLLTETPQTIAELEEEPSYYRRERLLAEQEKAAAAAAAAANAANAANAAAAASAAVPPESGQEGA